MSRRAGQLAAGLLAGLLIAACALPLVLLATFSFAVRWPFPHLLPTSWQGGLWADVIAGRSALTGVLLTSCLLSLAVAVLATAGGFVTARFFTQGRRRERLLLLAYAPFLLSPVVLGVCLLFLYLKAGLAGTFGGVVLAQTTLAWSFAVVFFQGFWDEEKRAFEDLVRTLGGSTAQVYGRAFLPLSRGALLLCFFQTFLISWFQYGLTLLIGGGRVQTLPIKVYDALGEANLPYAAVSGCLLVIPPLLLLWTNKRLLPRLS